MNEFDIEEYCIDDDSDDSEECDVSVFLSNYNEFFEKLETPPHCNTYIFVEKAYPYRFTSQRFFIINNSLYRILSKKCNVWDLDLNNYSEFVMLNQLMNEQREKEKNRCNSIVSIKANINDTECTVMSIDYSEEDDREFLDEMFQKKEEQMLQFI